MFVDIAKIMVKAGDGGKGCVAFRREAHVPHGGPNGGDGGKGGDVIIQVDPNAHTLRDYRYKRHYTAGRGQHGQGSNKTGRDGEDCIIFVPPGTVLRNVETGEILADLSEETSSAIVVKGGRGGQGNTRFATSSNRAPRKATSGEPGEELTIELELKTIADVGLVGHPNAGKSTLLSRLSAARPKVASYPFTTLVPNLGYVDYENIGSFVLADIPGLIEGAHDGKGLGLDFLRHIERTKILIYVIDITNPDPYQDYLVLKEELNQYNPHLLERPALVALNKIDTISPDFEIPDFGEIDIYPISAVTGKGTKELVQIVWRNLQKGTSAE